MNNYQVKAFMALTIIGVAVLIGGCTSEKAASAESSKVVASAPTVAPASAVAAPTSTQNAQAVTVTVDNAFLPAEVKVKAGQPVELTFDTKHRACAKTVVFKSLGITKELTDGTKTVVAFTPKAPGKIEYACGMDMLKGTVIVD